jgi:hypothetical protein
VLLKLTLRSYAIPVRMLFLFVINLMKSRQYIVNGLFFNLLLQVKMPGFCGKRLNLPSGMEKEQQPEFWLRGPYPV